MMGLLNVTMSEYSSTLNFSSGSGTSHADRKNTLKRKKKIPVVFLSQAKCN